MQYVALLRGINVGGKTKLPMAELRQALTVIGLQNIRTYIQSGNIIFESDEQSQEKLTLRIEQVIQDTFKLQVPVVLMTQEQFEAIAANTPKDWLKNPEFKYNYIFLKQPYDEQEVIDSIGTLKPEIESVTPGDSVLYQSMSIKLFGRTTTGKLASRPVYKIMTIRNHNTVQKLLTMLHE